MHLDLSLHRIGGDLSESLVPRRRILRLKAHLIMNAVAGVRRILAIEPDSDIEHPAIQYVALEELPVG
jgi:hypothetical protein